MKVGIQLKGTGLRFTPKVESCTYSSLVYIAHNENPKAGEVIDDGYLGGELILKSYKNKGTLQNAEIHAIFTYECFTAEDFDDLVRNCDCTSA